MQRTGDQWKQVRFVPGEAYCFGAQALPLATPTFNVAAGNVSDWGRSISARGSFEKYHRYTGIRANEGIITSVSTAVIERRRKEENEDDA